MYLVVEFAEAISNRLEPVGVRGDRAHSKLLAFVKRCTVEGMLGEYVLGHDYLVIE